MPIIEDLVREYGADHACRSVRSVDMPVLALEQDPATAKKRLLREIEAARVQDGAEAIVLGSAGMSDLCQRLQERSGMPVIYGGSAAVERAEALIGGGYRTSKIGSYDYPRIK